MDNQHITVTILHNPFNPYERDVIKIPYVAGLSAYDYVQPSLNKIRADDIVFSRNGVLLDNAEGLIPEPGDFLAVCPVVGKSGGGKQIFAMIASIALMVAAPQFGFIQAVKANTFLHAFFIGMVNFVGGMLINHLFPPPKPDVPQASTSTPSYSWGKLQPLTGQGNALATTYGTMRTAGQVLAHHITSDGNKQYLNILLSGGEGPIDSITDVRIDDNPISNFRDVAYEVRLGTNDQAVISNFNDTFADQAFNYELVETGAWATHMTEGNGGQGLEITVECPYGLYHVKDDGGFDNASVKVEVQYRLQGQAWQAWSVTNQGTITGAQSSALRQTYRLDNLPLGRYEVRLRCVSKSGTNNRYSTRVYWSQLSHIIYDDFARPGKVLIGIKALATDQLSGAMPAITWLQTTNNVHVWNPNSKKYETKSARNPAWAAYDIIHRCRKLRNKHTGQDTYEVFGRPASILDYQAFADWAAFCDEKKLVFEFIYDVAGDLWSALQKPESVGRGKVILKGTRYSCVSDRPSQPVQLFTVGNMLQDQFSEDFLGIKDRANAVEIAFVNKDKGYERDTVTVFSDDWDNSQMMQNPTQITLYGCTSYQQAYREGVYRLNLNKYLTRTVAFEADVDAIACHVGDVILVQHDVPQWGYGGRIIGATQDTVKLDRPVVLELGREYQIVVRVTNPGAATGQDAEQLVWRAVQNVAVPTETDILKLKTSFSLVPQTYDVFSFGEENKVSKPFRVVDISRSQELRRKITAVEYIEEIYAEAGDIPEQNYSDLKSSAVEVSNLSVADETYRQKDGTVISVLHCSWALPRSKSVRAVGVWYSKDNGQTWLYWGNTQDTRATITGVKTMETYVVKIRALNDLGFYSSGVVSLPIYITGKDLPPDNVAKLNISLDPADKTKISLTWTAVTNADLAGYEIMEGDQVIAGRLLTNTLAYTAAQSRVYRFAVRALDNSGNKSLIPATAELYIKTEPDDVAGFTAQVQDTDRTKIAMSWEAGGDTDIAYYQIRQGDNWETAKILINQIKATSYLHTLTAEGNITYMIKAYNTAGHSSVNASTKTLSIMLRPDTPQNFTYQQNPQDRSQITFTWQAAPGLDMTGYELRLGGPSWQNAEYLDYTKELKYSFKAKQSGTYIFRLAAKTLAGWYSNDAVREIAIFIEAYDVTGFTVIQAIDNRTKIRLLWDTPASLDVARFEIREGSNWETGTIINDYITTNYFETTINTERLYRWWIKAATAAGKYSLTAAHAEGVFELQPSAVKNIVIKQNPLDRSELIISWNRPNESDFQSTEVRYGYVWETALPIADTKEKQITYRPVATGDFKIMIKNKNMADFYSEEASAHFYTLLEPSSVTGLQVLQNGEYVEFFWDVHVEPDVVAFEIREGLGWDYGVLVATGITSANHTVKVDFERTYVYWVKPINRAGKYSQMAVGYQITVQNLPPKNIVLQYDDLVKQDGACQQVVFGPSSINWSNLGGIWSDYSNVKFSEVGGKVTLKLAKKPDGTYYETGEYLAKQADAGQVITANIASIFSSTVNLRSVGSVALQMRVSRDNITWSAWQNFRPAVYTFRYLQYKVLLSTNDKAKTPEVTQLTIVVDVDDDNRYGTATIAVGGATVSLGKEYYTLPAIVPMAVGLNRFAQIISSSKKDFQVKVVDRTGTETGGTINWSSYGY